MSEKTNEELKAENEKLKAKNKEQEILINYLENKMCILINKVYNLQNKRL
jgi:hypothetical protein